MSEWDIAPCGICGEDMPPGVRGICTPCVRSGRRPTPSQQQAAPALMEVTRLRATEDRLRKELRAARAKLRSALDANALLKEQLAKAQHTPTRARRRTHHQQERVKPQVVPGNEDPTDLGGEWP